MNSDSADRIHIEELEIFARVGVPESEREKPQRLTLSITLWPRRGFTELQDDVKNAVDYGALAEETRRFVGKQSTKLIETLAEMVAEHLLNEFALNKIAIELRKFVLPDTKHVSVMVTRSRD